MTIVLKCLKFFFAQKFVRIHPEIMVFRWSISKLSMEPRLCRNWWAPISIAIKDPKRGTTMAILALALLGAQNDQNDRGGRWFFAVGPKRLWKTVFAPQRSFSFQVSTHFWYLCTLHFLSGRYQYQTERTGLNSTNKYKYCGYKYNNLLRGYCCRTATGALESVTTKINESNVSQVWETNKLPARVTRTRINKLDFCKLGRHDLPYKWRKR